MRVWEALGPYETLEALEVGEEWFGRFPMDQEELALLLPARLDTLRLLYLGGMDKMDDAWMQALAGAGCGAQLTSLTLSRELLSSLPCRCARLP